MIRPMRPLSAKFDAFLLNQAYAIDDDERKVDLGCGVYRKEDGEFWLLPCVAKAKKELVKDKNQTKEELDPLGDKMFCEVATELIFGLENPIILEKQVFAMQTLGASGALRIAADFLYSCLQYRTVYVPEPTWENHGYIFMAAGFHDIRKYRYWHAKEKKLDIQGMLDDLAHAPANSVVILHACCHNPTGYDPSPSNWVLIAKVIEIRRLFPVFDMAYPGLASGDVNRDAFAIRLVGSLGIEMMVAVSFGKDFLLDNERVGLLLTTVTNSDYIPAIKSRMSYIVFSLYGSPPAYGIKIIKKILTDEALCREWKDSVVTMVTRLNEIRLSLETTLKNKGIWSHITGESGMFGYTGLTERQVQHLTKNYHIYMMKNGRINLSGINDSNIKYINQAINWVVKNFPD